MPKGKARWKTERNDVPSVPKPTLSLLISQAHIQVYGIIPKGYSRRLPLPIQGLRPTRLTPHPSPAGYAPAAPTRSNAN